MQKVLITELCLAVVTLAAVGVAKEARFTGWQRDSNGQIAVVHSGLWTTLFGTAN
jgi:hypothetical protein